MIIRVLLYSIIIAVGISGQSSIADDNLEISSFRWSADLSPGGTVIVSNNYGDIRVRNSKQDGLGVSAIIQNLLRRQATPKVDIVENPDSAGYRISVNYTTDNNAQDYKGRVDVTLLVPLDSTIVASTTFGNIIARFKGDIQADSESGALNIDTAGNVQAKTGSGAIVAWLKSTEWRKPITIVSNDGAITVKLKSEANVTVRAQTRGERVMRSGSKTRPPLRQQGDISIWQLGQGASELMVESGSGHIEIFLARSLEAVGSNPSAPAVVKKDLLTLPKSKPWKPGEAVKEVPKN